MTWRSAFLLLCFWGLGLVAVYSQVLRPTFVDSTRLISAIAFSDDEKTIAVAYEDQPGVWLFDRDSGRPLRYLHEHGSPVRFITFDAFNGQLLTVSHDEIIQWSLTDFARLSRLSLSLLPGPERGSLPGRYEYDPSRQLLFRSAGDKLFCYSLRQEGLGKELELKRRTGDKRLPSSGAFLAQAPDRKALWALDRDREVLRRIELEHFRQEDQLKIPGAIQLGVDNERIAVLSEAERGWTLHLFNRQLQPLTDLPVNPDWLTGPVQGMKFTGKGMISLVGADGLVDIHLKTGAGRARPVRETYEHLFFGSGGELFLLKDRQLGIIGPRGRLQRQIGLAPSPWLLHDEAEGVTRLFDGAALRDMHGQVVASLPPTDSPPLSADLRAGVLAVACAGGEVRLYRAGQKPDPWRVLPVEGAPGLIKVVPEAGRLLCMDGRGQILRLLDWEDGRLLQQWSFPEAPLTEWTVRDSFIWVGLADGRLEQYELFSGSKQAAFSHRDEALAAIAFPPGEDRLLLGGHSGISMYKSASFQLDYTIIGHNNTLRQMHVNRSGDRFLSIAHDGSLKIWETASGRLLEHIELRGMAAKRAFFLEGGPDIAVLTHSGILLYRPGDLGIRNVENFQVGKTKQPTARDPQIAHSKDGALMAILQPGFSWMEIWQTASGTRLHRVPLPETMTVNQLSFFDDRDILLLAGDCRVAYFDARSGQLLKQVDYCLAGLRLAGLQKKAGAPELWGVQQDGNHLFVFDSRSGDLLRSIPVQQPRDEIKAAFQGMQFSFNGRHLALFDRQGVFIYDTKKEQFRTHLPLPRPLVSGKGALSPDGSLLVFAAGKYSEQVVCDLFQEKVLFQFKGAGPVFLDNRYLAVAHTDQSAIDIWDCYRGAPVGTVEAGQSNIQTMIAHPFSHLVTCHGRGDILFWSWEHALSGNNDIMLKQTFPIRPSHNKLDVSSLLFEGCKKFISKDADKGRRYSENREYFKAFSAIPLLR